MLDKRREIERCARVLAPLCMASLMFARASVRAEEDDALVAAARALAVEGVKLAQNDQCGEAIDKLERAEKLKHSPVVAAHLGECYVKLGRLVEGVERLRSVLRDPIPANPSEAVETAYDKSKALLDATRPKLATLTVSVNAAPGTEPIVTIDGRPLPAALLGARHPVDPGEHQVHADAPGHLGASRKIDLAEGEEQSLSLSLSADPNALKAQEPLAANSGQAAKTQSAEASLPPPSAASKRASTVNHLPAYIAWGVGAAALGVGIGFGAAALGNRSDLRESCPNKVCASTQRGLLDTANQNATISTIGYATAIAGVAAGTVLFFVLGGSDEKPSTSRVRVGLASADLTLEF